MAVTINAKGTSVSTFQIGKGGTTLTDASGVSLTADGQFIVPASTTSVASLRLPHGTAPSSPTDGDFWTTTSSAFARINGSTINLGSDGGNVSNTGTPVNNQIAIWTDATTIEGDSGLAWDGSTMTVTGTVETNDANGPALLNEVASSTNPTVNPDKTDADTGLGSAAANAMSLITGGVEASRISAATVQTTDATTTEIKGISVPSGEGFGFEIHVMGTQDSTGDSVFERIFGAIRNQGGTTALIGSTINDRTDDTGASTWTIAVEADDTADELTVDVIGEAAHTIDWKVRVHIMNV